MTLRRQRNRWQRGLADTIFKNKDMILNPRFGVLGLFAIPYFFFVELLGPLVELLSYLALIIGGLLGIIECETLILYFVAGIFYGILMNIAALLMGEIYFPKYPKVRQFLKLIFISFLEAFGYRQLNLFWRLEGLYDYWRGNKAWGKMQRKGFQNHPPTSKAS